MGKSELLASVVGSPMASNAWTVLSLVYRSGWCLSNSTYGDEKTDLPVFR